MKITIVRHGETVGNVADIYQGQSGGLLTQKGINQARKVGKRLAHEKFDVVFCSDLNRTKQTASEIMKGRREPIIFSMLLRERSYGVLDGVSRKAFNNAAKDSGFSPITFRPDCGENDSDVRKRAKAFSDELKSQDLENVLIIGHGETNIFLIKELLGNESGIADDFEMENCSVNIIEMGNGKTELVSFNDVFHLS